MTQQFEGGRTLVSTLAMIGLAPVLLAQRSHVQKSAVRLPVAPGPQSGAVPGSLPSLRIAILGESSALGVGVTEHADSMGPRLSEALAVRTGRRVEWVALGSAGARLRSIRGRLAPELGKHEPDLVFLLAGVNDAMKLTSPRAFRAQVRGLLAERPRPDHCRWVFSSLPPVGSFEFLPQPLRFVLGGRAALIDRVLQSVAAEHELVSYAPVFFPMVPHMLAADGFHPSKAGYVEWSGQLANAACAVLPEPAPAVDRRREVALA